MASELKRDFIPNYGYYNHQNAQMCAEYVLKSLKKFHAVVLFINVEFMYLSGEDIEKTGHTKQFRYDVDENVYTTVDQLQEIFESCAHVGEEAFESSGITITNIGDFYFSMMPHGTANPTTLNVINSRSIIKKGKQRGYLQLAINRNMDSLIFAICAHFVLKENPTFRAANKMNNAFFLKVQQKLFQLRLERDCDKDWNLSNLPFWHSKQQRFQISVFSRSAILIYNNEIYQQNDRIRLFWNGKQFMYIKKLRPFLRIRSVGKKYCFFCRRIHGANCDVVNVKGTFKIRKMPEYNFHRLVAYSDFEAIQKGPQRIHECSGFSFLAVNRDEKEIKNYKGATKNITQSENIINEFFYQIKKVLDWYNPYVRYETGTCEIPDCTACTVYTFKSYIHGEMVGYCKKHLYRSKEYMPIYFHNFKSYDSKFIINYCFENDLKSDIFSRTANKIDQIRVIFSDKPWQRIQFQDSLSHLVAPLSSLAKQITDWKHTPEKIINAFNKSKGIFPYDYLDCEEKLRQDIPRKKEDWFSVLENKVPDEWESAIAVYDDMKMKNLGEYQNFYNKVDTIILMLVFEKYREVCINLRNIDPVYIFGAPSLALYCAYNDSPKKYIAPHLDQYIPISQNIRGGVSQVVKRHAKIENPGEYIVMLDINSLYSYVMMQRLPTKFYKEIRNEFINVKEDYGLPFCGIYLVDLNYPVNLHDSEDHRQFPLAPHKYNDRLCTTFFKKERYLCHEKTLKFYLKKGLTIDRVYYTWIFRQDYIMKDFIENNINIRNSSSDPNEKNLMKLLNNSLFGKTCENTWKYKNIQVKNINEEPPSNAETCNFINKDTIVYASSYERVVCCKPIQIGFSILELAKLQIYDFWYALYEKFQDKVELLYTDTDSLLLKFNRLEVHPYMYLNNLPELKKYVDLPYDKENKKWLPAKKIPGLFSDDKNYKPIDEFVGLRAKCYAIKFKDDKEILKNKGITKSATIFNRDITFQNYKQTLEENINQVAHQYVIEKTRKKYELRTKEQWKLALNTYDGKHVYLPDNITTIPFGYQGKKFKRYYDPSKFYNPFI